MRFNFSKSLELDRLTIDHEFRELPCNLEVLLFVGIAGIVAVFGVLILQLHRGRNGQSSRSLLNSFHRQLILIHGQVLLPDLVRHVLVKVVFAIVAVEVVLDALLHRDATVEVPAVAEGGRALSQLFVFDDDFVSQLIGRRKTRFILVDRSSHQMVAEQLLKKYIILAKFLRMLLLCNRFLSPDSFCSRAPVSVFGFLNFDIAGSKSVS